MGRAALSSIALSLALLTLGAGSASAYADAGRTTVSTSRLEGQVLVQLNSIRRSHGLAPLRLSRSLAAAADVHSRAMGRFGFFRHESQDGTAFWQRVKRFYGPTGYRNWSVGENLLWSSGTIDAGGAVRMWMASPPHRANILAAQWREIGLSALRVRSAPGVYGGRDVVIFTSDFGARV